jgi:predicted nuclease of predicted toxin-antitoxin system
MTIWIDAQLSPAIAPWIATTFGVQAVALRDLGLRDAIDHEIFMAARRAQVIVMTKDSDFVQLLDQYGAPPQVIWLTCGNTSNANLKIILGATLSQALDLLADGERLIEISGA